MANEEVSGVENNRDQTTPEDAAEHEITDVTEAAAAESEGAEAASEEGQELDLEAMRQAMAAFQGQIDEQKEGVLRAQAEVQNVRRRAERDVENAHKFALDKFSSDLLPIIDSLERALDAAEQVDSEAVQGMKDGVALTLKMFVDTLAKHGIDQVDPMGEPFDPQLHQAMSMVPNPDVEPNSVMAVMQKGYRLHGRLVRPAMVVVSKSAD